MRFGRSTNAKAQLRRREIWRISIFLVAQYFRPPLQVHYLNSKFQHCVDGLDRSREPLFDNLFHFLSGLQTPNLERLTVHCTFLVRHVPNFNFISPDYQHPQLRSLSLHCNATACSWEAECLVMMFPSVTHLTLWRARGDSSLVYLSAP